MNSHQWALLAIVFCAAVQAASGPPPVVAVVNDRKITRQDLERRMAQSRSMDPDGFEGMSEPAKKRAINRILQARIVQELEYQEAVKQGIRVSDQEVSRALDNVRRNYPTSEAFEESLSAGQITVAEWKQETKEALTIARLEETVAAGLPASEWSKRRPDWLHGLRDKARIWVWVP